MVDPLLGAAIGNNAEWCDAVCQSRGISGVFSERLWFSEARTPPYYPNIITLTPNAGQGRELRAAAERVRAVVGEDISIKDSFADADLADVGMRILFGAT